MTRIGTEELSAEALERLHVASRALSVELDGGWSPRAAALLAEMTALRENNLISEVGHIVRELHDSLAKLPVDARLSDFATTQIPDARARLEFVMVKTEEAANRTLSAVDTALPLSQGVAKRAAELAAQVERLQRRELEVGEFRQLIADTARFLGDVKKDTTGINACLSEALMAQEFQDITGQVIRRVTEIVEGVEDHLIELLQGRSGALEERAGNPDLVATARRANGADRRAADGPQLASGDPEFVTGQDDVDDLLSNLGF